MAKRWGRARPYGLSDQSGPGTPVVFQTSGPHGTRLGLFPRRLGFPFSQFTSVIKSPREHLTFPELSAGVWLVVSSTYLLGQGYITLAPPAPYHAPLSCIYKARVGRLGSHGIIFLVNKTLGTRGLF